MKKYSILQTILVIVVIGILAILLFVFIKKIGKWETNEKQVELTNSGVWISGANSLQEAEQKQVQDKIEMYNIYNNAVDKLDITVCDKITDEKLKTKCMDNVYSALSTKEKNETLCEKIQDMTIKVHCINSYVYEIAIASGKQSDCNKISGDNDLKRACTKNVIFSQIESQSFSGKTNVCESLGGDDKNYCINRINKSSDIDLLQLWTNTKNINICGQIKDISMKNTCSDTVYIALAMEKQDGSICNKIIDSNRKTNCLTQFARVNDASILQKAITKNNLSLCTTITTPDLRTKCSDTLLLKLWVVNKDIATCTKIIDTSTKKQCNDSVNLILKQLNKK